MIFEDLTNAPKLAKRRPKKESTMNQSLPKENVLRISGAGADPIIVNFEGSEPVTVRLQIDAKCNCQDDGGASRPGSYAYSDPRGRTKPSDVIDAPSRPENMGV